MTFDRPPAGAGDEGVPGCARLRGRSHFVAAKARGGRAPKSQLRQCAQHRLQRLEQSCLAHGDFKSSWTLNSLPASGLLGFEFLGIDKNGGRRRVAINQSEKYLKL